MKLLCVVLVVFTAVSKHGLTEDIISQGLSGIKDAVPGIKEIIPDKNKKADSDHGGNKQQRKNKHSNASLKDMVANISKKINDNKVSMEKMLNVLAKIDELTSKSPLASVDKPVADGIKNITDKAPHNTTDSKNQKPGKKNNETATGDKKKDPDAATKPQKNDTGTADKKSQKDPGSPKTHDNDKSHEQKPNGTTHDDSKSPKNGSDSQNKSPATPNNSTQKPSEGKTKATDDKTKAQDEKTKAQDDKTKAPDEKTKAPADKTKQKADETGKQKNNDKDDKKSIPKSTIDKVAKAIEVPGILNSANIKNAELTQNLVELILGTLDSLITMETTITNTLLSASNVVESELESGLSLKRILDLVQDLLTTVDAVGKELIDLVTDVTSFATDVIDLVSETSTGMAGTMEKAVKEAKSKVKYK